MPPLTVRLIPGQERAQFDTVLDEELFRAVTSLLLSVFSSIHGVFHSTAFMVAWNLAGFLAVVFWLGLAYWVYKDARRRTRRPWLVGVASVLGLLLPYVGPVVYTLFCPAETLEEVRARQVELQVLEQQLDWARPSCPICCAALEADFLVCPVCTTKLRKACMHCGAPVELLWQMCPYCATDAEQAERDLSAALTAEARAVVFESQRKDDSARAKRLKSRLAKT